MGDTNALRIAYSKYNVTGMDGRAGLRIVSSIVAITIGSRNVLGWFAKTSNGPFLGIDSLLRMVIERKNILTVVRISIFKNEYSMFFRLLQYN